MLLRTRTTSLPLPYPVLQSRLVGPSPGLPLLQSPCPTHPQGKLVGQPVPGREHGANPTNPIPHRIRCCACGMLCLCCSLCGLAKSHHCLPLRSSTAAAADPVQRMGRDTAAPPITTMITLPASHFRQHASCLLSHLPARLADLTPCLFKGIHARERLEW